MKKYVLVVIIIVSITAMVLFIMQLSTGRFKPSIPSDIKQYKDVEYIRYNEKSLHLDLYIPNGSGPFPVIVWFHSGAWKTLDKSCMEQGVMDQVKRNYVIASVDYSLSMQEKWPAQLVQAKTAVRWLRAHAEDYNLNPDKIIAWGISSGGQIASVLGTAGDGVLFIDDNVTYEEYASDVQAVIAWCAPVDLGLLEGSSYQSAAELLGDDKSIHADRADAANPISYLDSSDPPFYIMHGTRDNVVGIRHSEMLYEALEHAGIDAYFKKLIDYEHTDRRFNLREHMTDIEKFIDSIHD